MKICNRCLMLVLAVVVSSALHSAEPLKVLAIGNSFSVCAMKETPKVAAAMQLPLDMASIQIGGCSLERHWSNVTNTGDLSYSLSWSRCGVAKADWPELTACLKPSQHWNHKSRKFIPGLGVNICEALKAAKWDIVTIQQCSHQSWVRESYHPFGDNLVATIRKLAPTAKIVVQETWSYTPWDTRLAKWGIDQNEMYAKLHAAYADFAGKYGFEIIPTGTAVQLYRQRLPVKYTENSFGGDVVGGLGKSETERFRQDKGGKWHPASDVFHFNEDGHYLQALVWTAAFFGVDVTTCTYAPSRLAPARAKLMREVARDAIKAQRASSKKASAIASFGGALTLTEPQTDFKVLCVTPPWNSYAITGPVKASEDGSFPLAAKVGDSASDSDGPARVAGSVRYETPADGALSVAYRLRTDRRFKLAALYATSTLPIAEFAGGSIECVNSSGKAVKTSFPKEERFQFAHGRYKSLRLYRNNGACAMAFDFATPTHLLFQDGRRYGGGNYELRLFFCEQGREFTPEREESLVFTLRGARPYEFRTCPSVRLKPDENWIALPKIKPWVEPGSALDFSSMPYFHAPAGKFGRVLAKGDNFEFENRPGVPQRFLGVNLCFTACVPPVAEARPFAANLRRLGYNAVRFHHHDGAITADGQKPRTLDDRAMEKFDALAAACIENGLYITTDLYVSRPVTWRQIGIDRDGSPKDKNEYKELIMVHEPAYADFIGYARAFLSHINPHTGRSYAHEPALAFLSLINEGNLGNRGCVYFKDEPFVKAWHAWLDEKSKTDSRFVAIPRTVPGSLMGSTPHSAAYCLFIKDIQTRFATRVRKFLREETGCQALITDNNGWTNPGALQLVRRDCYDYFDDHRYVDHPAFLGNKWSLPMSCVNENTLRHMGTLGVLDLAQRRIFGMPYTVSEFNYSGPGEYRAAGGLILGSLASLQGWSALWRFAWSHGDKGIVAPEACGPSTFDLAGDMLMLASDRPFMTLFLRRDLAELRSAHAMVLPRRTLENYLDRGVNCDDVRFRSVAWWTRLGSVVADAAPEGMKTLGFYPEVYDRSSESVRRDVLGGDFAMSDLPLAGDGRVRLEPEAGAMSVATERTCAGYRENGVIRAGALEAAIDLAPALVGVTSVDGESIVSSHRLVVSHLTDLHGDGMTWADPRHKVSLAFGRAPALVRRGTARVSLALERPGECTVWALRHDGKRLAKVPAVCAEGKLAFTADVASVSGSAIMHYEIVRGDR